MKWPWLLTIALLLAPVTVADGADEACDDARDKEACMQRWCRENPEECREMRDERRGDAPEQRGDEQRGDDRGRDDALRDRRHVGFEPDAENATLRNITVQGRLVLDALSVDAPFEEWEREDGRIEIEGADWRLRIRDSPTGNLHFKGNATITFDAPDGSSWMARGESWVLDGPVRVFLVGDNVSVDGDVAQATGFAALHVGPAASDRRAADSEDGEIEDAKRDRRLGGEVHLRGHDRAAAEGRDRFEVVQYDDVEVQVVDEAGQPLRIVFSAELDEGRAFVLDIDPALLAGPDLVLRYFDVHDDGTETEVLFLQADGLEDALDPNNDGGQPEYLILREPDGDLKALVTVPHWSVHAISIASVGEFLTEPSVLIGIGAGLGGVLVAAIVLMRPRRSAV